MSQALTELNETTALTPAVLPGARTPSTPATIPVPGQVDVGEQHVADRDQTIDAQALRDAIAAAEAEEAAAGQAPHSEAVPTSTAPTPSPAATPAEGRASAPAQQHVVPVGVVRDLRQQNRDLAQQNAYLQGQLDAARAAQPPQQVSPMAPARATPSQPTITAEDRRAAAVAKIQDAERRMDELAASYDNGEISTMKDFQAALRPLLHEVLSAQFSDMAGWLADRIPAPQAPVIGLADEKVLSDQVATLEAAYPWSKFMDDADFRLLEDMAMRWFELRGINLGAGPRKTFLIRERVAKLAQIHGPELHPELVGQVPAPAGAASAANGSTSVVPSKPGAATPASLQPNPLRTTQAAGKMALAAAHPPAIPGAPATSVAGITEEQIERMSPAELEATIPFLPKATQERLLFGR